MRTHLTGNGSVDLRRRANGKCGGENDLVETEGWNLG